MADTATPNVRATPLVYFIEKKVTRLKQVHYCCFYICLYIYVYIHIHVVAQLQLLERFCDAL